MIIVVESRRTVWAQKVSGRGVTQAIKDEAEGRGEKFGGKRGKGSQSEQEIWITKK